MIDVRPSLRRPGRMATQALGLDQGGNCIRLGQDRAFIWTPFPILDPRAVLLTEDRLEKISGARIATLRDLAPDRAIDATMTLAEVIAGLLKTPPVGAKWKPVVPTREGNLEIWLGPPAEKLFWSEKVARRGPFSQDVQDTFTRTAGNLAGSTTSDGQTTWAEDAGTAWATNGTEATISGSVSWNVGRLVLAMDTADHYSQADLSTFTRNQNFIGIGVMVRANATPTSGYGFEVSAAAANKRRVYDFVTDADIASDTTAPAVGLLYLELNGSTYTAKVAGSTVFTGTDTTYDGTVKGVGISVYSDGAGNVGSYASYRGADLAGGPTTFPGTGDLDAQAAAIAGSALHHRVGSGAPAAQAAALAGTGTVRRAASGTPAAQAALLSGTGVAHRAASGSPAAGNVTIEGAASVHRTATGAPAAGVAVISGTAIVIRAATGALQAQDALIDGSGTLPGAPVSEPETGLHPLSNLLRLHILRN
jgi:hypothetical protein